jgi:2-polyprenyl-3-methyl-5-hydroxy-6-metoxy-1,4-benzoquinol methylase
MAAKFKKGDKEIYENIFDGLSYYQTVGEVYHTNRSKHKVHQFYVDALRNKKDPKVLDIGCYIGTDVFMLPKTDQQVETWAIDVSEDAIDYAKKLAKMRKEKKIHFGVHDANNPFKYKSNFFDVIICLEVIEHLHNPLTFLKEMKRILKKGGTLILSTPNEGYIMKSVLNLLPKGLNNQISNQRELDFSRHGESSHVDAHVWDHEAHISVMTYQKLAELVVKSGLKVEVVEGSSFFGGSRFISNSPFLLGAAILADSVVDKLPFKPNLQMCTILKVTKS